MEILIEQILIYGFALIISISVIIIYVRKQRRESKLVTDKITQAQADGLYEPVTLYPVVDINRCIKSGACVDACPEHDVLGIRNGKATIINASRCIGHGACFRACPVEAITLWMGTEKRGVDLPQVSPTFETNVPNIYIAGELGGMGLIKNAITQGKEAVENIAKSIKKLEKTDKSIYDLLIIGAGPAGIAASLTAKKLGLNAITLEQDTLGGTIFTFPRSKVVMTSPVELPLYGKVKFKETSKTELLELWNEVITKNKIKVKENSKVESITAISDTFEIKTNAEEIFTAKSVLISIGRRGSPRKLNIPGENTEKVAYRLLEPDNIKQKNIVIVGGGDSAVESALLLARQNQVTLSYRAESFSRLKKQNADRIQKAMEDKFINVIFNSQLTTIEDKSVSYTINGSEGIFKLDNELVFIFAGGQLPTQFLKDTGIEISTVKGKVILKHK